MIIEDSISDNNEKKPQTEEINTENTSEITTENSPENTEEVTEQKEIAETVNHTEKEKPDAAETPPVEEISAEIQPQPEHQADVDTQKSTVIPEEKVLSEINRVDSKLKNEGFVNKAPKELIDKEKEKRETFLVMLDNLENQISKVTK